MKKKLCKGLCLLGIFFICSCQIPITRYTETFNQNVAFLPDKSDLRQNPLHGEDIYLEHSAHVCNYYTEYNEENDTTNVMSLYKKFFSDYEILGTSDFTGNYENPNWSASFAYNIGADILLTAHSLVSKSGRVANKVSMISNDYWTGAVMSSNYYEDYKYKQEGLFLRKKNNNAENIWLQTEKSFPPDGTREELYGKYENDLYKLVNPKEHALTGMLSGNYENDFYKLYLYSSGEYIVAVVNSLGKGLAEHKRNMSYFEIKEDSFSPKYDFYRGEVKFYFNKNKMTGVYLRSDRCPVEAVFSFSEDKKELVVKRSFDSEASFLTFRKMN